ncbi:MAG: hypothetical protein WBC51_04930 [Vicinamibacterales bacterium]
MDTDLRRFDSLRDPVPDFEVLARLIPALEILSRPAALARWGGLN